MSDVIIESKRFMIKAGPDMAKAEEEAVVDKLHEIFSVEFPGNYLSSLFTAKFCAWVCHQIHNDIMPEPKGYAYADMAERVDRLESAIDDRDLDLEGRDLKIKELKDEIIKLKAQVDKDDDQISQLQYELDEANSVNDALDKCIEDRDNELIRLKAMLFDYQNPQ